MHWTLLLNALMVPGMVKLRAVRLQLPVEMPLIYAEEMVAAFLANSAIPALGERVYRRGLEWRADDGWILFPT